MGSSWTHAALRVRAAADGQRRVYATAPIPAGALLCLWGGEIVPAEQFALLPARRRQLSLQVEDGHYLAPTGEDDAADFFNHSCDPNAGLDGPIALRALRDIAAGEEVRYDYAMSDGSPYDEFPCGCGAATCRGQVTGEDWRRPELQERYRGSFSPYLLRRIAVSAGR